MKTKQLSDGHWVTIHGEKVFIGGDGNIKKGPKGLVGKSADSVAQSPRDEIAGRMNDALGRMRKVVMDGSDWGQEEMRAARADFDKASDELDAIDNKDAPQIHDAKVGDRITLPTYTGAIGDGANYGTVVDAEVSKITPKFVTVRVKHDSVMASMFGPVRDVKIPRAVIEAKASISRPE